MIVCCDIFSTYVNDYNRIIFMRDRQQQKRCYREKTEQKYGGVNCCRGILDGYNAPNLLLCCCWSYNFGDIADMTDI